MNPIIDTAMLKHHRVDYGSRIDTDGPNRRSKISHPFSLVMIAVIALGVATSLLA